jgi:tetratricopeptide (TPR) repeat protein
MIASNREVPETHQHRRARAHIEREEFVPAWAVVSELLNDNADDPRALYLAGAILRGQGHVGMALQMFRRSLAFVRDVPNIWLHYGACLHDTNKYDEAREVFQQVIKMIPGDPVAVANIAAGYTQLGLPTQAVEWADKALAIDPDSRAARIAKAFGELGQGHWAEGWKYADALYGEVLRIRVYRDKDNEEPDWDGTPGKTVVIQADQGLGDMLMHSQQLTDAQRDCKQLIVETNSRLIDTFQRNFPGIRFYPTLKDKTDVEWPRQYEIDAHLHISALGRFYRQADADFPRRSYIAADNVRRKKWRAWLEQFPRPWVGIAWRGGIQRTNEELRSVRLAQLQPILAQGGTFISLAYQNVGLEVARWNIDNRQQVILPDIDNEGDYGEWLALMAELDHVISVLTTVVHACGAMGKRCWVLCSAVCQWQHCYEPEDGGMIWYAPNTITNYRQPRDEGWESTIERMAADYAAFVLPLKEAA